MGHGDMKRTLAVLALLALAACSAQKEATKQPAPSVVTVTASASAPAAVTVTASAAAPSETASEAPTSSPPDVPSVAKFGESFTYKDGLAVLVSKPTTYKPGQYNAGYTKGQTAVLVTVKLTNKSKDVFKADSVQVELKAGADGNTTESIYDSSTAGGPTSGFTGTIAPGRSATVRMAYSVAPADTRVLNVEVRPDYDREAAIFEGAL